MRLRCKCGSCKEPDVDKLGGGCCLLFARLCAFASSDTVATPSPSDEPEQHGPLQPRALVPVRNGMGRKDACHLALMPSALRHTPPRTCASSPFRLCRYATSMAHSPLPFNAFWRAVVDMYVLCGHANLANIKFYQNKRKRYGSGSGWRRSWQCCFSIHVRPAALRRHSSLLWHCWMSTSAVALDASATHVPT